MCSIHAMVLKTPSPSTSGDLLPWLERDDWGKGKDSRKKVEALYKSLRWLGDTQSDWKWGPEANRKAVFKDRWGVQRICLCRIEVTHMHAFSRHRSWGWWEQLGAQVLSTHFREDGTPPPPHPHPRAHRCSLPLGPFQVLASSQICSTLNPSLSWWYTNSAVSNHGILDLMKYSTL